MKRFNSFVLIFLLSLFSIQSSFVQLDDTSGYTDYDRAGPFVSGPANVGMIIFLIPGVIIGGVVGLVVSPFEGGGATPKKFSPIDSIMDWGMVLGLCAGKVGYYIFGTPFYAVKKVFYDGPKSCSQVKRQNNQRKTKRLNRRIRLNPPSRRFIFQLTRYG